MQVYCQKPSSYPTNNAQRHLEQRQKAHGQRPALPPGDSHISSSSTPASHTSPCPTLPRKAWFTGIAQMKDTARAGDTAATHLLRGSQQKTAAKAGRLPVPRAPFQGPSGKQGQLGAGHRTSYRTRDARVRHTPAHRSDQSGRLWVRTRLQFLSAFHLVTPVVTPKLD